MEMFIAILIIIGLLFILLLAGVPVAFSFLFTIVVGSYLYLGGIAGLSQSILNIFASITVFTLVPVAMFILLGEILFQSGLANQTVQAVDIWLGRLPGRLSLLTILGGAAWGALSGSALATTSIFGTMMIPEMRRRGYQKLMYIGPVLAVGGLDTLIPPSNLVVIYGTLANVSIAQLLIGTSVPGIMCTIFYLIYIFTMCKLKPNLAPPYDPPKMSLGRKAATTGKYFVPAVALMFIVTGFIFFGISTPEEAAAVGVVGTILLTIVYKSFSWQMLKKATGASVELFAMVFLILTGSTCFSQLAAMTGITNYLASLVLNMTVHPLLIVIVMQLVVIILGLFIDELSNMMIVVPLFTPALHSLGIDPLWFAVLIMINLKTAMWTPPFGLILCVMKGVVPDVSMTDIIRAGLPFFYFDIIVMVFVFAFPPIATFLPGLMVR